MKLVQVRRQRAGDHLRIIGLLDSSDAHPYFGGGDLLLMQLPWHQWLQNELAAGRFDAYYHLTLQPWDLAAASLLVREAGGKITDWTGKEINAGESRARQRFVVEVDEEHSEQRNSTEDVEDVYAVRLARSNSGCRHAGYYRSSTP